MPLYEFECEACASRFERIQKYTDPLPEACPKCGKGPVRKLLSSPAIQFKGSGFYITDYAKKSSPDSSGSKSGGGDSASGTKKTEAQSGSTSSTSSEKSEKSDKSEKKD